MRLPPMVTADVPDTRYAAELTFLPLDEPHMFRVTALLLIMVALLELGSVPGVLAQDEKQKVAVDVRDIHRDGKVAIVGHFGIPIGQKVTVEGHRAKRSILPVFFDLSHRNT